MYTGIPVPVPCKQPALIEKKVTSLSEGKLVVYADMGIKKDDQATEAQAFSRLVKAGMLERTSTGLFYKPKKTVFGELKPQEELLLRPYLYEANRRIAYVTGTALYNQMGLTTQVPSIIQVASREKRITAKVGSLRIKAVKSYVDVSEDNYRLLELLDAIKDFKFIPDLDKKAGLRILKDRLAALPQHDKKVLVTIALSYPPRKSLDWGIAGMAAGKGTAG